MLDDLIAKEILEAIEKALDAYRQASNAGVPDKAHIIVKGVLVGPAGDERKNKYIDTDHDCLVPPDVQEMLDALVQGDTMGAWNAVLWGYVPGSYYQSVSSISVTFS